MQTDFKQKRSQLYFDWLPRFARYLLDEQLEAYSRYNIELLKSLEVPLLKAFASLSDAELLQLTLTSNTEQLTYLEQNKARQHIENGLQQWRSNSIPQVDKHAIVAEDITYISYARRQSLLHFVPFFCKEPRTMMALIDEIELYMAEAETASTNMHIELLKEEISTKAHLLHKINNTLPGAVYVFDVVNYKGVYSNNNLGAVVGYTQEELNDIGENAIAKLLHPDDAKEMQRHLEQVRSLADGEIKSYKYRVRGKDGAYHWIRNYEAPFKRDSNGVVIQTIGITLNIDNEENLAAALEEREAQYKKAESLANMGHYNYEISSKKIEWTDQLYVIYGLTPQSESIDLARFLSFVLPEDHAHVLEQKDRLFQDKKINYTFRIRTGTGAIKTIRSIAQLNVDEKGRPVRIIGAEQDVTEKQKLIEQLKRSEQLHKQAQALAQIGNWTWYLDEDMIEWSDEMYRIYEIAPEEKLSLDLLATFVHPDEREAVANALQQSIEKHEPYDKYHRIVLRNGTIKNIHRRAEIITDSSGKPIKLVGTTQDVTEQKATEQELRDNQNFIKKIADATPSIIASYNVNSGKYVFINEGLKKLLGYDTSLILEKGTTFFLEIVHPDDRNGIMKRNARIIDEYNHTERQLSSQAIIEFTYRMRHQNGTYRWFQTYGTIFDRNAAGRVEHVLNISLDITDQVEAEKTVKAQEHFIKHIADASPTILYIFDVPTNKISYINKEIYYVLGYTMNEILEMGDAVTSLLYHPDEINLLPERKESNKKFQHTDSMIQYECRLKGKEGQWCWLLVREVIFETDAAGNVIQILGAALDITKRKDMEKTMLQNSFLLEQSNASLEEFAYVASHDLKEPLRKISTFGDRLMNSQADRLSDDGKLYLTKIIDASQRMQIMINDLLSVSMISGNRSFETYSLQSILEDVLQTLEFKIEQKNARIEAGPLPQARIIPSQFRQLFQNLISNSLKFMQEGVQPHITVKHDYLSQKEVTYLDNAARYLKLEFTDNGIGFEEEYAGKIFAIFQRLHGRSEYEGTGIGLAICKKIVEHHGGIIYAHATPGKGATFTVLLPA